MSKIRILTIVMLFLASCQKKENESIKTTVSGKLLAANSNLALPNAEIRLVQFEAYMGFPRETVLDSVRTDSLGNYSFDFDIPFDERYDIFRLFMDYPNYYSTRDLVGTWPLWVNDFELGGKQSFNPELYPFAWVKIKLDFPPSVLRYGLNRTRGEPNSISIYNPNQREFIVKTQGNSENILASFIETSDQYIKRKDTVFCGNNDTTLLLINF